MQSTAEAPKKKPEKPQPAPKPLELAPNPFAQEQTKPPQLKPNPFMQEPAPRESGLNDVPKKMDLPAHKEKAEAPPPLLAKTEEKKEPGAASITPKQKNKTQIAYEDFRKAQEARREKLLEGEEDLPIYHAGDPALRPRGPKKSASNTYLDRMGRLGSVAGRGRHIPEEESKPEVQKKKKPAETEEETKL